MRSASIHRQKPWLEHFFGVGVLRARRLFRLAFRDLVVELAMRCETVPFFSTLIRRWYRGATGASWLREYEVRCLRGIHANELYRVPIELAVTDIPIRRALVLGTCMARSWIPEISAARSGCPCDLVLLNHVGQLPASPPRPVDEYDLQIVQIALDAVLPETSYFGLPYVDADAHRKLFEQSQARLAQFLAAAMRWNEQHGLLTFVPNFFVPQQNPMGRLMPRYDLRNPVHFVEQLNASLSRELERYNNAYLLDIDQIAATLGKKFVQDDLIVPLNHGNLLWDGFYELDVGRFEKPVPTSEYYHSRPKEFIAAAWAEITAMHRTLRQADSVKLVAVDLDDTLWRGILAEDDTMAPPTTHGWPLGLVETLCYLKKRGVLLAIASKNNETRIAALWDQVMLGRLHLEDFAIRKINWRPKVENVQEIIREANILSRNVVFIDDNPVERAGVKAAIPDIRVLGSHPYYMRRILLWSPETQVAVVSDEAGRRTEMIQAQVERESSRQSMSRDEFLSSLAVKVTVSSITSADHRSFPRAFELINKTNQFNTTGRRWSRNECIAAFGRGLIFYAFEVEDRFTRYGLVGVVIADKGLIEQFVMSCRVLGLDVETAALADIVRRMQQAGSSEVRARMMATDNNLPCRDLYERCGFACEDGQWVKPHDAAIDPPNHVAVA